MNATSGLAPVVVHDSLTTDVTEFVRGEVGHIHSHQRGNIGVPLELN